MISTDAIEQILSAPGVRELGLDDRGLDEVLAHASQNRFLPAAVLAQSLWQQKVYDVRVLGCYLFGVFLERGVSVLGLLLECAERQLATNLAYLSPAYKRERHLDVSLRWFFDRVVTQLRFHERQKDATWKKWNDEWLAAAQQQAAAAQQQAANAGQQATASQQQAAAAARPEPASSTASSSGSRHARGSAAHGATRSVAGSPGPSRVRSG